MSESRLKPYGSTFCVYPWVEQVVQSSGRLSFCCVADKGGTVLKEDGSDYLAAHDKLSEAWNSNYMRDVRKAMLSGEKVAACQLCYFQEGIGKKSYREMHNEEWMNQYGDEIEARIQKSVENDYHLDEPALYLDLRLGNLCNLKCRSCNPYNSSQIFRETDQLLSEDPDFSAVWSRQFGGRPAPMDNWYDRDELWEEIMASIPKLRKVYLTGGEPTLIENNYHFLQACVDSGHSKNIFLLLNSNCTTLQDRFLELLPHFRLVVLNASIDGHGSVNEYIRFLSRWETVSKNFEKLLKVPGNVQVGVTPVVQIYNALSITDLLDYVEKMSEEHSKKISVDFLYATHPSYLDLNILPESVRKAAVEKMHQFVRRSKNYGKEGFLTNSIDSWLTLMQRPQSEDADWRLKDFVQYTQSLDRKRNQVFARQFPELHSLLAQEGTLL